MYYIMYYNKKKTKTLKKCYKNPKLSTNLNYAI